MKTSVVLTASAIALASCATSDDLSVLREGGSAPFSATRPNVYLLSAGSDVRIAVDQEPLIFQSNTGSKKIKWKLHDNDYKLEPIEVQSSGGNNPASGCATDAGDDSVSSCDNNTSVAGTFKYTIRVTPKHGAPAIAPLDPTIVNR